MVRAHRPRRRRKIVLDAERKIVRVRIGEWERCRGRAIVALHECVRHFILPEFQDAGTIDAGIQPMKIIRGGAFVSDFNEQVI